MLTARESAPGSLVWEAFPRFGAVGKDGEPWLRVRRSGECGQVLQPGQDLGKQAVAGRQPQGQVAGVADQPAGDRDQRHRKVAIMALPPRTPCPARMSVRAVSWCSQAAIVAASSSPHIQAVLTWGYPEGRCRGAAPSLLSRKMFSTVVRCRYQCSAAATLSGLDMSRLVKMNEYA
jgi:hypothetical protein